MAFGLQQLTATDRIEFIRLLHQVADGCRMTPSGRTCARCPSSSVLHDRAAGAHRPSRGWPHPSRHDDHGPRGSVGEASGGPGDVRHRARYGAGRLVACHRAASATTDHVTEEANLFNCSAV
jgi:hypothetical protein